MKVGIVGAGAVGSAMAALFPGAVLFDEPKGIGSRAELNSCDIAFVCVPTPSTANGACDVSIVDAVVSWISGPLVVIRSTVSVGTCRTLAAKHSKRIVFQPEYGPAETPDHPFNDLRKIRWLIFGGNRADAKIAARAWQAVYSADVTIAFTSWETAELCKYMENAFLATKVAFCNEFFDIASAANVDYEELRELWLLDPRIGKSHTFVFPDKRGFGGKCLPKDLQALIACAAELGVQAELMSAVDQANANVRRRARSSTSPNRSGARS